MFTCETCSAKYDSVDIVETGIETTYKAEFQGETLILVRTAFVCGDEHKLSWDCEVCGAWNEIAGGTDYEIAAQPTPQPTPKPSDTHSTCDNCGGEFWNKRLHEIDDLWQRITPGGVVPSGQCPSCGCLCYPSKN
jgi:hypothetical protein